MIPSVKALVVVVLLQPLPFAPNLFCSTSLLCSTYLMQVERMVEVDQAESCKPSCLRRSTVLLPPQPLFAIMLPVIVALQCRVYLQIAVYLSREQKSL